ncbi:MAG: hypothetical protein KAS66_08170 [Candidatus Omnitrophica bacterium]|nr:hypothetical protein [Candidatus Omnitrophota bacterium]
MISITQKNTIYDTILKSYTVDETVFEVNCIYDNQVIAGRVANTTTEQPDGTTGYPLLIVSYIPGIELVGDLESNVSWKSILMSVDVYAQNYDNRPTNAVIINGRVITDEISRQLINDINDNWNDDTALIAENVKLQNPVMDPTDLSRISGTPHVYRNNIDINLIYKEE